MQECIDDKVNEEEEGADDKVNEEEEGADDKVNMDMHAILQNDVPLKQFLIPEGFDEGSEIANVFGKYHNFCMCLTFSEHC